MLLDRDTTGVDRVVALHHVVRTLEIHVQQDPCRPRDGLDHLGADPHELGMYLGELGMKRLAQLGHPNLPVT